MRNLILSLYYKYKSWKWERKCIKYFGAKPETIYLSAEDYDALVERINAPPDPKAVEHFKKLMQRRAPWDEQ